jgi:arylsulfatase A-like enzyme
MPFLRLSALVAAFFLSVPTIRAQQRPPNVVLIYADDLGYGDLSCYGTAAIKTPHIDRLAAQSLRFGRAYATSATCTPSRYSLLTGEYAWRRDDTGIAPGDAAALIQPGRGTLGSVFRQAGYQTGIVGKWHLGLGGTGGPDWNGAITAGPVDVGFTYSYIMAATGDRVPCVYIENRRVVGLSPDDPIRVSYKEKIGNEPTGRENPELLKMKLTHGHDMTIVNGISRIGYMTGGQAARWIDEDMADVFTGKAVEFIRQQQRQPFFLFFATHDIHVPRAPHARFAGRSGMGPRGDALLQFDESVGKILRTLDELDLTDHTLVILTSDNGPVLDDGYQDEAFERLGTHAPAGPLRGGKYSAFEAGTRVPMLARWPGKIRPGTTTDALWSQVDFLATFAALTRQPVPAAGTLDSENHLAVLLGQQPAGRAAIVEHALTGTLGLTTAEWKYIEPSTKPAFQKTTRTELGNAPQPQLYRLRDDPGEQTNRAGAYPEQVRYLRDQLERIRAGKAGVSAK